MKQKRKRTWSVLSSSILLFSIALGGAACSKGSEEKASMSAEPADVAVPTDSDEAAQVGMPVSSRN